MTYLVTGGSGFIGSHLVESLLNDGHSVINIDNFDDFYDYKIKVRNTLESVSRSTDFSFSERGADIQDLINLTKSENYTLYYGDIRNLEVLRAIFSAHSVDLVIHLAALAGVRPSIERPLDYEAVNVRGTINIWEICREFKINKLIIASSSSVYGNNLKVPFHEDDRVDCPISPYAATKRSVEILGHVYHHLYGMSMIQLRFFTVYGPRQRPDLAIHKFAALLSSGGIVPVYGDGSTARDYTYIADIIDGIKGAALYLQQQKNVYEIINLGESEVITLQQMICTLERVMNLNANTISLPLQPGDVLQTSADISKARSLLNYQPQTSFQNGIKNFVEWFLKNGR